MRLTPQQVEILQSSFRILEPLGSTAAPLLYLPLFKLDPSVVPLFKGDMKEQGRRFKQMPAVAVGDTPGLPTLAPVIKQLGIRHSACDLRRAARALRVGARGAALGHRALLQDTYTEEAHTTWMSAYPALAGVMKDAVRVLTWDAQTTC